MKLLFAIVLILVISLLGSRISFINRRLSLGFRNLMFTGTVYIIIGVILGKIGLNVLDVQALNQLEPFLVFGLCWIGFLFGLQFNIRQLKTIARKYIYISVTQAFVTFVLITAVSYFIFNKLTSYPEAIKIVLSLILGSAASCTAQSALAITSKNYKFKNRRLLDLMRYISGLDGFFAALFFIIALSFSTGGGKISFDFSASFIWFGLTLAIGIIPALIFITLSRVRFTEQEFLVFVIGTVILCGGLAHQINHSPLITGLICGIVTANFCRHRVRASSVVLHAEKSLYIILLLILGAGWHFSFKSDLPLIITGAYIVIRFLGKYLGGLIGVSMFKVKFEVPKSIGVGLISDGGFAVAIIIDATLIFPEYSQLLSTVIISSVFVNELISPWLILGRFKRDERQRVDGNTSEYRYIQKKAK